MKKILTHILHFLRNWSKSKQTLTLMERSEKKIQTPLKVQDRKILDGSSRDYLCRNCWFRCFDVA
jgi:hypothetical protein